jgi:HlyD family secretion protein
VKTGVANWEHSEITQGLQGGERIVTSLDRGGVVAGAAAIEDTPPAP